MGKDCNCQPKLQCPSKLSIKIEGEIKIPHEKKRLKEFKIAKPALHKILEEIIQSEESNKNIQEVTGNK